MKKNPIVEMIVSPLAVTITRGYLETIYCGTKCVYVIKHDSTSTEQYKNYDEMSDELRKECYNFIRYRCNSAIQKGELKVFSV